MKLLLDENLSLAILGLMPGLHPKSRHLHDLGLGEADDRFIWDYAKENGFVIASKDSDHRLSL